MYFTDRCDVQRRSNNDQAYGGKAIYGNHLSQTPCRYIEKSKGGFNGITAEWVQMSVYKFFFPHTVDVRAGDRIQNVSFQDDKAIVQNFEIENITSHRGRMTQHKTAMVKRIS